MDQFLSLLSGGKLSKKEGERRQGSYKQSIMGIEEESFQLRDGGGLSGGRGTEGQMEGGKSEFRMRKLHMQ